MKLWLDAGDDDPFLDGDAAFEDALRAAGAHVVVKSGSGGHDLDYWNGNWDEYLHWYAHVLKGCGARAAAARKADEKQKKKDGGKKGASGSSSSPSSPGAPPPASSGG
jgi:hypothetical protein